MWDGEIGKGGQRADGREDKFREFGEFGVRGMRTGIWTLQEGGTAGRWRKWGGGDHVELMGGEVGRLEKFGRDDEIGKRREFQGDKPGLGGRWTTDARGCGNGRRKFSGGKR